MRNKLTIKQINFFQNQLNRNIRLVQISLMGVLLSYGVLLFDFSLSYQQIALTFLSGFLSQGFWIKKLKLKRNSLLSAFITCLSIALLLRSHNLWIHPLSAFLAINSKFLIQNKNQHFFNPSAFGIFLVLFLEGAWLSPGQWGSTTSLAVWITAFGCLIAGSVRHLDISWLFLFFYLGGLFIRNLYLGYEIEILYHTALKGSLLLFAFFMISDPRSSPGHLIGKIIFSFLIAVLSLLCHYYFYTNEGLIYSLVLGACFTPFLNWKFPAKPFEWQRADPGAKK